MDDFDIPWDSPNMVVVLWIAGGLAVAFFLVVAYDAIRKKRQDRGQGRHRRHSEAPGGAGVSGWYRRTRSAFKTMKAAAQQRRKYQARLRQRDR